MWSSLYGSARNRFQNKQLSKKINETHVKVFRFLLCNIYTHSVCTVFHPGNSGMFPKTEQNTYAGNRHLYFNTHTYIYRQLCCNIFIFIFIPNMDLNLWLWRKCHLTWMYLSFMTNFVELPHSEPTRTYFFSNINHQHISPVEISVLSSLISISESISLFVP